jgi:dihydrofolate reductase
VDEVSKLRRELNGEIVVAGSFQLLRTLMEHDLVDEMRLKVFPVVLGAGERLFGETATRDRCVSSTVRRSLTGSPSSRMRSFEAHRGYEAPRKP